MNEHQSLRIIKDGNRRTGRTQLMLEAIKKAVDDGQHPVVMVANRNQQTDVERRLLNMGVSRNDVHVTSVATSAQGASLIFRDHYYEEQQLQTAWDAIGRLEAQAELFRAEVTESESRQRGLVQGFADRMEARFAEKDGTERCNRPVATNKSIVTALIEAALECRAALWCGDKAHARKKAVDAANFAAILDALLSLPTAEEAAEAFTGKKCESGCVAPVVAEDSEGVPLCRECFIELLLEPLPKEASDDEWHR